MQTVEITPWGKIKKAPIGIITLGTRRIHSRGENEINPGKMIPLHGHPFDSEEYIALSSGLQVLIMSIEEMNKYTEKLTENELLEFIKKVVPLQVGEKIICPKGHAHALYNSSNEVGAFSFCKYFD